MASAAQDPGLLDVAPVGESRRRTAGSASAAHPLGDGQREHLAPAGEPVEHEAGEERQPHPHRVRQRQGDDATAAVGGVVRGREL